MCYLFTSSSRSCVFLLSPAAPCLALCVESNQQQGQNREFKLTSFCCCSSLFCSLLHQQPSQVGRRFLPLRPRLQMRLRRVLQLDFVVLYMRFQVEQKKVVVVAVALIVLCRYKFLEVKVIIFSANNQTASTLCDV